MAEEPVGAEPVDHVALPCTVEQTELGEGVRWDARRQELLRVDILAGRVFRDRVQDDGSLSAVRSYALGGTVGMVAPIDGDNGWLLGAGQSFVHLAPDGTHRVIATVAPSGTRMNDGACDPQGRFWAGTTADDHRQGAGALYRLDRDGHCEIAIDGLTISNGVGWSPDGSTMYLVDSGPGTIDAFDFDGDDGSLSGRRTLVAVPSEDGSPDGMTVDAAGDLWVAIYGGGQVRRYRPDGTLRDVWPVPASQSTCCAFGGPRLDTLFVTTATEGWTDDQRRAHPEAGLVYRVETDATGRAAAAFAPDHAWWRTVTG